MSIANEIRMRSLEAVHKVGKGHIGGVLSCAEILSVVYSGLLRPGDRFLLGKGHAAIGLYAALALTGHFPMEEMQRLNQEGMLGEEPSRKIPGVEINAGSLGHGLGLACGIALGNKLAGSNARTYVLLGDGDCLEGSTWEAAMFAARHGLNIVAIVDRNKLIIGGTTEEISGLDDLGAKFDAFGMRHYWCDGHDESLLENSLNQDGPIAVIAQTIKGKGVSFMEGRREWHHGTLTDAQLAQAKGEIHGNA